MTAPPVRLVGASVAESVAKLAGLIAEARDGGAAEALGYRSWTEYVGAEFADSPLWLDRDDRRELVVSLAQQGMTSRAIAPLVGASQRTVANDMAPVEQNCSTADPDVIDAELVDDEPAPAPAPPARVTGLDGKSYPRRPPKARADSKPTRRPLTDAAGLPEPQPR